MKSLVGWLVKCTTIQQAVVVRALVFDADEQLVFISQPTKKEHDLVRLNSSALRWRQYL